MWPCLPVRSSRMTFMRYSFAVPAHGRLGAADHPPPQRVISVLRNRVGHEADEAGTLDRLGEDALLQGRDRGDAGRHDLAALRHVALQQANVLVVDLGRVRAREGAGLATTLERTARLGGREILDGHFWRSLELEPTGRARVTVAAAEAAAVATGTSTRTIGAVVVAVTLLQHGGRAFLELVDAHRHEAQDVFIDAHLALHLGDGRGRGVDVEQAVVGLAVLLDAVAEGLEAPIFVLGHLAAALGQDFGERVGQFLDLLGRNVLAGEIDMLVEGHEAPSFWFNTASLARSPSEARKGDKAVLQRAGTREAGHLPYLPSGNGKPSVQPPAERM